MGTFLPNILLHEQLHYDSNYGYYSVLLSATNCLWRHWDAILLFYLADFFLCLNKSTTSRNFQHHFTNDKNLIKLMVMNKSNLLGREEKKGVVLHSSDLYFFKSPIYACSNIERFCFVILETFLNSVYMYIYVELEFCNFL